MRREMACYRPSGGRQPRAKTSILCDTWEIADAMNQRLQDHFTNPDTASASVSREQQVRVGDLVLSRHNDAGLTVRPGIGHRRGDRIDQVRNGNRWRVIGVDTQRGCIVAERLTDSARVIFEGDYLREHIVLGYAGTVHSAQGMTIATQTNTGCAGPSCPIGPAALWPTSA
jgi:ATP-dependent exoDNAse (exonuclease V) alpha subunit